MSRARLALFLAVCLAQLAVPLAMAFRYERTLRQGELYRFRTEPIDPVDAFRGRYVAIRLRLLAPGEIADRFEWGEKVTVVLASDPEGFAVARAVSAEEPEGGAWLTGTIGDPLHEAPPADGPEEAAPPRRLGTRIDLPLDRYYMEETKAPAADRIWTDANRQAITVARVRVRRGLGAIEGLDVNGVPIERWIETLPPNP